MHHWLSIGRTRGRPPAAAPLALALLALALAMPSTGAQAQGFFDFLFGRPPPPPQQAAPRMLPQGELSPVRPSANRFSAGPAGSQSISGSGTGRVQTYCVRLCDGRYFPLERQPNLTPARLCAAFCPASATKVFTGAVIDQAVAPDGERYPTLKNAYLYRKRLLPDCTCNGRDVFGLATLNVDVVEGMPRNEAPSPAPVRRQ